MVYALLATLPALLVLSALASGSETALFSLNALDREEIRRRSPGAARAVGRLLARPRILLIQVLVLNMTVNVLYFVVSSLLAIRAPDPLTGTAIGVGSVLGIILFGEVIAKVVAGSRAASIGLRIAHPLLGIQRLMSPLLTGLDRFAVGPLARLFHPGPPASGVRREELTALLEQAGDVLSDSERHMLRELVGLRLRRARDIMLPRVDLRWVGPGWSPGDALPQGQEFVPVSSDGLHRRVEASIDAKQALVGNSGGCLLDPVFVPEQARLDQLLSELARRGAEHAYCVDEHGEIHGLIRIDDIVDELVTGVSMDEAGGVMPVGLGVWRVPGRMPAHDFADIFSIPEVELASEEGRVSTVAGLVLSALGRVPCEGDRVEIGRVGLTVRRMKGRAIEHIEVRTLAPDAEPDHG